MARNYLMKIFPLLLQSDESENSLKVRPSDFMKEINFTTEERIKKMLHHKRHFLTETINKTFTSAFKPSLPMVLFQKFSSENTYCVSLNLLNTDKIARSVTITCEKTPHFSVCYNSQAIIKVAPGISEKITVKFKPIERKDYHHKITFIEENGSFDIPIFAIGPRPLLDFPDHIQFGISPVKVPTTKVLCVSNIGELCALFTLCTKSPFEVTPRCCMIKSGTSMQIAVTFDSAKVGSFQEFIEITYETGEKLYCKVDGTADNSVVMLNTERLNFEDTFAGLSRTKEISILNYSSHMVYYKWMNFPNEQEDNEIASRLKDYFCSLTDKEQCRATGDMARDIINPLSDQDPSHGLCCMDSLHNFSDTEFLFKHPNFFIEPTRGEIWPGKTSEIQITFMPDAGPAKCKTLAFCETSGCEERHCLQLLGKGLGPNIELALHVLDIGNVFASMKNSYEIVVANKGDIPGQIRHISKSLTFGGLMECYPKEHQLKPREHKAFVLSFVGMHRGDFIEEIMFKILESNETRKLIFKGHIHYGTLEINKKVIELGNLAPGFPVSYDIILHNPSLIPISYTAYITGNGKNRQPLLSTSNLSTDLMNQEEIFVEPNSGNVEPDLSTNLTIKFVPMSRSENSYHLVIEMWDGLIDPAIIPITYETVIPEIKCSPHECDIGFCFINYPYSYEIQMVNPTEYPVRFATLPQEFSADDSVKISSDIEEGIIKSNTTVSLLVSVIVYKFGKFSNSFKIKFIGTNDLFISKINGNGMGPIVTTDFEKLDWEKKPVFTLENKIVMLSNDSPIPAIFSCDLKKKVSPWSVHPVRGIIAPNSEIIISVELYLQDSGSYDDTIIITIWNSNNKYVNLSAIGYGTSIITYPPISPFLDLGSIFCSSVFKKEIIFINYGRKDATIVFVPNKKATTNKLIDASPVFDFNPKKLTLAPGQQSSITIEAQYNTVEEIKEAFWFWKADGGQGKRTKILEGYVMASFINFCLNFSAKSLKFISKKKCVVRETLLVINETDLPKSSIATVDQPFALIKGSILLSCMDVYFPPQEVVEIEIEFNPSFLKENRSQEFQRILHFSFENLSLKYQIELNGEVQFPYVRLDMTELNFGWVQTGNNAERKVTLTNASPFPAKFQWKWNEGSVILTNNENDTEDTLDFGNEESQEFSLNVLDSLVQYVEKDKNKYLNLVNFPELTYYLKEEDEDINKFITLRMSENIKSLPISWVFDVTPNYGELEPYRTMEVIILFKSYISLEALATLACFTAGGVCELLYLSGKSSTISYHLDKTLINFNKQVFCSMCYEDIEITNTGIIPIYFKANCNEMCFKISNSIPVLEPCSLMIEPTYGYVPGNSSVILKLAFYPGMCGPLNSSCSIEIKGVEPIYIEVETYGVLPQIYLHLPKDLSMNNAMYLNRDFEYDGIANINKECISEVEIEWDIYINPVTAELEETDWVLILYEESFPTVSDICLAIERSISTQYISVLSEYLAENSTNQRFISIPGFVVPPYIIDMGLVLIGEETTYTVLLENFSEASIQFCLPKETKENMIKNGLNIDFPNGNEIPAREMAAMCITIFPTKEMYPTEHHDIDVELYTEVTYGARIPIKICAEATIPFISVKEENLNFGKVKCRECRSLSIILTNIGWTGCDWEVSVIQVNKQLHNKKKKISMSDPTIDEPIFPFSAFPSKGELAKGEGIALQVLFEPPNDGIFKGQLIIKVEKNPNDKMVTLKGFGLDPVLKFNQTEIIFTPIMPCIQKSKIYFLVNNPNKHSVEIFFPAFSRQILEEELIYRLLLRYYEAEDLMIPARSVGEQLHIDMKEFYLWICNELMKELQNQGTEMADKMNKVRKKSKSQIRSRKSSSSSGYEDKNIFGKEEDEVEKENFISKEIIINEYLSRVKKGPSIKNNNKDPIKNILEKIEFLRRENLMATSSLLQSESVKQPCMFIFHGAPFSDYVHIAHRASRFLGLPIINLDDILLREIVLGDSPAGSELNRILLKKVKDFFTKFPDFTKEENLVPPSAIANSTSSTEQDEGAVEAFSNKLATYLLNVDNFSSKVNFSTKKKDKPSKVKSIKSSSKSKSKSKATSEKSDIDELPKLPIPACWLDLPQNVYFQNIPESLMEDILSMRIKKTDCLHGFIVPTLHSVFFQNMESILKTLVRVSYRMYFIECIFVHNTFEKHIEVLREKKELEDYREKLIKTEDIGSYHKMIYLDIIGKLNILNEKYNYEKGSDAYLDKIKNKIQQMRKFSKISEFTELENAKTLLRKSMKPRSKKGGPDSNAVDSGYLKKSKSRRSIALPNEGSKSPKKGPKEPKSKLGKIVSSRKSRPKSVKSDTSSKQQTLPFSETALSVSGLQVGKAVEVWNQFDNYNTVLKKMLTFLESWSITSEKRTMDKHNLSSAAQMMKSRKKISFLSSGDSSPSKDYPDLLVKYHDYVGIPVTVVDSPDINSLLTKSFFDIFVIPKLSSIFSSAETSENKNILNYLKTPPDMTYWHIKESWFNRMRETLDRVFSIRSIDSSSELSLSLDINDITQEIETVESLESLCMENDKHEAVVNEESIYEGKRNSGGRISKQSRSQSRRSSSKKIKKMKLVPEETMEACRVLKPGETVAYSISFNPHEKGEHISFLTVELLGWQKSYSIKLFGTSDCPTLDSNPSCIFSKCAESKPTSPTALYPPTYFHDIEALDFGLLLVENKLDEYYTCAVSKLTFHNISPITVQANFRFENEENKHFSIDREYLEIKPKELGFILVKACPKQPIHVDETLLCTVNNNPREIRIKLKCIGYIPEIEIYPKQLLFDRILLYRKETLQLKLINKCATSFFWCVLSNDFIDGKDFNTDPVDGFLPIFSSVLTEIDFYAASVQVITKRPLHIAFFHKKEDTVALFSETVLVSAEVYDVQIDIYFARFTGSSKKSTDKIEESNHLDFGLMKTSTKDKMLIGLANVGKCDVNYELIWNEEETKNYSRTKFDRIFSFNPVSGLLKYGEKVHTIVEVECFPTIEVEINNVTLFKCFIVDPNVLNLGQSIVAKIPINISLTSVYSKFSIFPFPELNFGVMRTHSLQNLSFTICNKGKIDFSFTIAKSLEQNPEETTKEAMRTRESPKKGAIKYDLEIGCYNISPCTGTVSVSEAVTIVVHCKPAFEGELKETVYIKISNTPDNNSEFILSVLSCLPYINFSDPEKVFMENVVCESFNVFKWPLKLNRYSVYSKNDNELAFKNIFVGHNAKARLCLMNKSLVYTSVKVSVGPVMEEWRSRCLYYNRDKSVSCHSYKCFSVRPTRLKIPPSSEKWITVSFIPAEMTVYGAYLKVITDYDGDAQELIEDTESDLSIDYEDSEIEIEGDFKRIGRETEKSTHNKVSIQQIEEQNKENPKGVKETLMANDGKEMEDGKVMEDRSGKVKSLDTIVNEGFEAEKQQQENRMEENKNDFEETDENSSTWFCYLSGEGLLPEIILTQPYELIKGINGKYPFIFPSRRIGTVDILKFGFQNIGYISCKVIIEFDGDKDFFNIFPTEEACKLIEKLKCGVPLGCKTVIDLKPKDEVTFWFHFYARAESILKENIIITPIGNPYGTLTIMVDAEIIKEGIIIEGLDYVKKQFYTVVDPTNHSIVSGIRKSSNVRNDNGDNEKNTLISSEKSGDDKNSYNKDEEINSVNLVPDISSNSDPEHEIYSVSNGIVPISQMNESDVIPEIIVFSRNLLDFKNSCIGKAKVVKFWLINHSQISYEYVWFGIETITQLVLYPVKGVLEAFSNVQITAELTSDKPFHISQALLKCHLKKVTLLKEINDRENEEVEKILGILREEIRKSLETEDLPVEEEENILNLIEYKNNLDREKISLEPESQGINNTKINMLETVDYACKDEKIKVSRDLLKLGLLKKVNVAGIKEETKSECRMVSCTIRDSIENNEMIIPVIFRAIVNYPSYSCDLSPEITFENVAVGQSASYDVTLQNIGEVPFKFYWKLSTISDASNDASKDESYSILSSRSTSKKKLSRNNFSVRVLRGKACTEYFKAKNIPSKSPFKVVPEKGRLLPNGNLSICKVIFSPQKAGHYKSSLVCSIKNISPGKSGPFSVLRGTSKNYNYYFDYKKSSYLTSKRRELFACLNERQLYPVGCLHPQTEAVEINAVGIGQTYKRTMNFYNLLNKESEFNWINQDTQEGGVLEWTCCKPKGLIQPQSVTPMTFEFTPSKIGLFESHWHFSMVDKDGKTKFPCFLFVGIAAEPSVYFSERFIILKPSFPGVICRKNAFLINDEDISLTYEVREDGYSLQDKKGKCEIYPMRGVLEPKSETLIRISYISEDIGKVFYRVKFSIQRRPSPLFLSIYCKIYELLCEVAFHMLPNLTKTLLKSTEPNDINFGLIREKTNYEGVFEVTNKGHVTLKYCWSYNSDLAKKIGLDLHFSCNDGCILPRTSVRCSFTVSVLHKSSIQNFKIVLKINQGLVYVIYLSMVAKKPQYTFSFTSFDFGYCLVPPPRAAAVYKEMVLIVKGKDKNPIVLECKYCSTPYMSACLERSVILCNEEVKIPIRFSPKEIVKYKEKIPFIINEKWEQYVTVTGEGIPLKLELVNSNHKLAVFKSVKVGKGVSKVIPVINRTSMSLSILFRLSENTSVDEEKEVIEKKSSYNNTSVSESSFGTCMDIFPDTEVILKKGEVIDICVTFCPSVKMTNISKKILAKVKDFPEEIPLSVVNGCSEDSDVCLTTRYLQFGPIVKDSTAVSYITLVNQGDGRVDYHWDPKGELDHQFTIDPVLGFCCSGQSVSFRVAFTPTTLDEPIECKVICQLEGLEDISFCLSGKGVEYTQTDKTLSFKAPVRGSEKKSIVISNRSDQLMEIRPLLRGRHFYGAEGIIIQPYSEATYQIIYAPNTLTKPDMDHQGLLYVHVPSGEEYSWKLIGICSPPLPSSKVIREIQCKIPHVEILTVQNWLPTPQIFHVTTELNSKIQDEPIFSITGYVKRQQDDTIERKGKSKHLETKNVMPNSKKKTAEKEKSSPKSFGKVGSGEPGGYLTVPANIFSYYKINFVCYHECTLDFKVFFTNEDTDEYLFHEISFVVTETISPRVMEINTKVRRETTKTFVIENPLSSVPLTFSFNTELDFISLPEQAIVAPNDKETIIMHCFPLQEGYFSAPLIISCPELGVYSYELKVNVKPLHTNKGNEYHFAVPLGSYESLTCPPVLQNYAKKPATFICEVNSPAFLIESSIIVPAESMQKLNVIFEPTEIGNINACLTCTSDIAGSFSFKLYGICTPPKIQGPIVILLKSEGTNIVFKNVFAQVTCFNIDTTYPFKLGFYSKSLEPKEETIITVTFMATKKFLDENPLPVTGSLTITLAEEVPSKTKWEYYLKGVIE